MSERNLSIEDIKQRREETKPQTEAEYFARVKSEENRKMVNELLVNFMQENELGLEEMAVGFSDVFTSIILSMILKNANDEAEVTASNERFEKIHVELATVLNAHHDAKIAETVLVLNSLFLQGITSIIEEAGK